MEVNKIYNEDCLETLKRLPDNSVDLVIADPPYEIVSGGGGGCFGVEQRDYHKGVKSLSDGFENVILDECKRVLKVFNCHYFVWKTTLSNIVANVSEYCRSSGFRITKLQIKNKWTIKNKKLKQTQKPLLSAILC